MIDSLAIVVLFILISTDIWLLVSMMAFVLYRLIS